MKNGKKLFVYFYLFNVSSVLSMESRVAVMNNSGSHVGMNCSRGAIVPTQHQIEFEQERIDIPFLKAQNNIILNEARDRIDECSLGMNRDIWFRGIRGTLNSLYKSYSLTDQQVMDEMSIIESYLPDGEKEYMLKKLEEKHWYVDRLLQRSVYAKIKEIEHVKGTSVDILHNPSMQEGFKRMVHMRALEKYFLETRIKNPDLFNGPSMGRLGNIHWAALYGHENNIQRTSLKMSSDGKYLWSIDTEKNEIVWDMEQGKATDLSAQSIEQGDVKWIAGFSPDGDRYIVLDRTQNYFAETFTPYIPTGENRPPSSMSELYGPKNMPVIIEKKEPAIVLFKRPKEESYLCQQAFYNSREDEQELIALRDSKSFAAIEGFPKENLKKQISKNLETLKARL